MVALFSDTNVLFQGRPINKLQNGIILLVFKIWKIQNIGFVGIRIRAASD